MRDVHFEDIIGGCKHHFVATCEHHGLKHVGYLGYIGHLYTVGVTLEYVERQGCDHRVAHGVLLVQVSGIGAWFNVPPCAPFVYEKSDAVSFRRICP